MCVQNVIVVAVRVGVSVNCMSVNSHPPTHPKKGAPRQFYRPGGWKRWPGTEEWCTDQEGNFE